MKLLSIWFGYRSFSSFVQATEEKLPTKCTCRKMQVLRGKVLFVNSMKSGATKMVCVPDGYSEPDRKAVNQGTCEPEKDHRSCLLHKRAPRQTNKHIVNYCCWLSEAWSNTWHRLSVAFLFMRSTKSKKSTAKYASSSSNSSMRVHGQCMANLKNRTAELFLFLW